MNRSRKQSSTNYPMNFFMADSTDHIAGKTGLEPTVTISKNGGAFAAAAGAVTEIGNGWYSLAGNATDRNTLGEFLLHSSATGADPTDEKYTIESHDPFNLAEPGAKMDLIDAPNATAVTAIQSGLALDSVVAKEATLATVAGYLDTEIADIKAKTDLIPASPAAVGSAMTLTSDYPLKTDLATKAEIAAINEKIDTIDSNVDAILVDTGTTIPALINSDSGAGTIQHTYTLEAPVGTPCADARIYLSTDSLKANIIHEGITNALGQVTFNVDLPVGTTVYLWRYKTGVDFVNPDVEEI